MEAPCLATYSYSTSRPRAFQTFPIFCGFSLTDELGAIDFDRPLTELTSLLQSWLYFGLMSECLGYDIDSQTFVKRSADSLQRAACIDIRVKTSFLVEFGARRDSLTRTFNETRRKAVEKEMLTNMALAQEQLRSFESRLKNASEDFALVALSVRMLLHVLTFQFKLPTATVDAEAPSTQIIMRRMLENGWCRQRIAHACREFSYPTLYYLSNLRRHIPQHLSHSRCTDSACKITAGDVEPSHRMPNCECDSIDVSMGEVVKIIESGGVPLIRVKRQDQPPGTVKLEIIRCTASSTYTAISHVWSDRQLVVRENTPNALPQCQLEHLDMILAQIPPSSGKGFRAIRTLHNKVHNILCDWGYVECPSDLDRLFWLDSICVPNEERHSHLRTKAVNGMDMVYAGADRVLVLDAELKAIEVGQQPMRILVDGWFRSYSRHFVHNAPARSKVTEVAALLFASAWMGRARTLQEGCLALECIFQTAESPVMLRYLSSEAYRKPYDPADDHWFLNLRWLPFAKSYRAIFGTPDSRKLGSFRFILVPLLWPVYLLMTIWSFLKYAQYMRPEQRYDRPSGEPYEASAPDPTTIDEQVLRDLNNSIISSLHMRASVHKGFNWVWFDKNAKEFWQAWDSLQSWSTTKKTDLFTVVANLASFNAGFISKSAGRDERMRSIIFNLTAVPLDILFSDYGDKYGNGAPHPDRWIPLDPVGSLRGNSLMRLTNQGLVLVDAGYVRSEEFFLMGASTPRRDMFRLAGLAPPNAALDKKPLEYWVKALVPAHDKLVVLPETEICLVLSADGRLAERGQTSLPQYRGARFLVTRQKHNTIFLQYDCAIRAVQSLDHPEWWTGDTQTAYEVRRVPLDRRLILETGAIGRAVYPVRPSHPFCTREKNIIIAAVIIGLIILIFEWVMVIEVRKTVLPTFDDMPELKNQVQEYSSNSSWYFWDPTIGRIDNSGAAAVTAFVLLLFTLPGLYLNVHILMYIFNLIGYKSWASTFAEDWTPQGIRSWWWAFLKFNLFIWMSTMRKSLARALKAAYNKIRPGGRDQQAQFALTNGEQMIRAGAVISSTEIPEPRDVHHSDRPAYCRAEQGECCLHGNR
jgi:hypothetical protein